MPLLASCGRTAVENLHPASRSNHAATASCCARPNRDLRPERDSLLDPVPELCERRRIPNQRPLVDALRETPRAWSACVCRQPLPASDPTGGASPSLGRSDPR